MEIIEYNQLIFKLEPTHATLLGVSNIDFVSIKVPKKVNGHTVLVIDEYALSNCTMLKYVHLPSTVEKIGFQAFANCPALEYIDVWHKRVWFEKNDYQYLKDITLRCPKDSRLRELAYEGLKIQILHK